MSMTPYEFMRATQREAFDNPLNSRDKKQLLSAVDNALQAIKNGNIAMHNINVLIAALEQKNIDTAEIMEAKLCLNLIKKTLEQYQKLRPIECLEKLKKHIKDDLQDKREAD